MRYSESNIAERGGKVVARGVRRDVAKGRLGLSIE